MRDPPRSPEGPGGPGRTLVIQTAFLGDVILTTPLLTAIAGRDGPVDVVTTPAAAPLLESHPAVHRVIRYDKRGADRGWRGLLRLAGRLRRNRYARAVLPHRSWRTAALARLAGIPDRTGFAGPAGILYTGRVPRPGTGHEVERLLALAPDRPHQTPRVVLGLTEEDRSAAAQWLEARALGPGFVALAPGSIWGTKRWPYYAELAAGLEWPVVVLGGAEDRPLAESVAQAAAGGRGYNAAGQLSLRVSAAILEHADLLVTNDSAPLHLATACGLPVVAIFGPTVPAFGFGPRGSGDRVIEHSGLPCRPCSPHGPQRCPLGHHRCMREIPVEMVLEAVNGLKRRA